MNENQYIKDALTTESPISDAQMGRINLRLLHAVMGMQTETAELTDALKKHIFYGAPLDKVNMLEEIGDVFWYVAILLDEMKGELGEKASFESIMNTNIAKLKARYPNKFTEHAAMNRDLVAERNILEK